MANLFAIPIRDQWLIHAPLHRLSALVNRAALERLRCGDVDRHPDLQAIHSALLREPEDVPTPLSGDIAPLFMGFITTRACNIACAYCDFGGPTAKKIEMDPKVAVSAIDWMADRLVAAGRRRFHVHLFGGEPFHSPDSVDLIVHRVRYVCAQRGLEPWFEVSTNGVFNESLATFIGHYFDSAVLSFDGPPEFHDRNRAGFEGRPTYEIVARSARRLSELPVELCLRACITQDSVTQMEQITRWMCREFKPAMINHEPLTENELTRRAGLTAPDPYDFAVHWMRSFRAAREHGIKVVYSAAESERPRISSCPVGTDTLIVSPDGRASACYMLPQDWQAHGMNMDVARVGAGGSMTVDYAALNRVRHLVTEKPRCEKCFCQWTCAGGCHVTHSYTNCSVDYNDFCLQTRIVSACLVLEKMGAADRVDALLRDRPAMERLANHEWDVVEKKFERLKM